MVQYPHKLAAAIRSFLLEFINVVFLHGKIYCAILLQMDYINTSHPGFVGGSKAVELAQQQVKTARMSSTMIKSKVIVSCFLLSFCYIVLFSLSISTSLL